MVTVASHAHAQGRIDFDDLQGERSYSGARAYNQSKLANILFTHELAAAPAEGHRQRAASRRGEHRLRGRGPRAYARLLVPFLRPFMKSAARGAATSIHVASAPELVGVTGGYFANSRSRRSAPLSYNQDLAARLWRVSEDLVGVR